MTERDAKIRIAKLRSTIEHHRYQYHVLDRQEISDAALDSLKHELFTLEQQFPHLIDPSSPTQRVGGKPLASFTKVRHAFPMLSIEDVFTFEELTAWEARLRRLLPHAHLDYFVEIKMDGLAVSLVYERGHLVRGATRGDGSIGEDVTSNLKTVQSIPLALRPIEQEEIDAFLKKYPSQLQVTALRRALSSYDARIEVRGEIFMRKKTFEELNDEQVKKGAPPFANPRNASAGSIRQLDPSIAASRKLDFFAYALMEEERFGLMTHEQVHGILKLMGFAVNPYDEQCTTLSDVEEFHSRIRARREELPFWTDGIVVAVNENATFKKLGTVGKAPRGVVAYKFPAAQVTTVVEEVTFQVGRTGVLTPVARLRPVRVAGTTVSHATLHNIDEIRRLGIKIGDTVVIEKAGDIIPKVIRVLSEMRTGVERPISISKTCPICGSPTVRREDEVALVCSNKSCFAQEVQSIIHFVSRKAFNIDGLGEKIVEQLVHGGLIQTAADLFTLTVGDLEPLERFAAKAASNLVEAIEKSKSIELPRFLYALGIRHVGEQTAIDLANHFGTLKRVRTAREEDFLSVPNIGEVVAQSLSEYCSDHKHAAFLDALLERGVRIVNITRPAAQPLAGKTFVLTGTLATLTREEAQGRIRKLGGTTSESVSKKTSYVVVGVQAGSKHEKAKKLKVPILSEEEFLVLTK